MNFFFFFFFFFLGGGGGVIAFLCVTVTVFSFEVLKRFGMRKLTNHHENKVFFFNLGKVLLPRQYSQKKKIECPNQLFFSSYQDLS